VKPGAYLPAAIPTGFLGSGTSPAREQPDADASAPKWHPSGAIQTVALVADRPIALHDMETFLNLLQSVAGPKLLHLTGLVALADDPGRPLVLHSGSPAIYPGQRLAAWPSEDRRTRMIAITRDLDPAILKRLFAAVTAPWPDRTLMRVAVAASAALVVVLALGLGLALRSNARTTMEASSTAPWTQARGF
jgi:hypothetical protein